MNKPIWIKIIGLLLVGGLVTNLILMGFQVYQELVFWIILVVLGVSGWILVKVTKSISKK